jgi:uncharacterized protein (TIGR00730 family)
VRTRGTVAVYGSSVPGECDADYATARRLGGLLAAARLAVLSGGYGGVMEAVSRGAREAGGRTVGITCELFGERRPNPYLDEIVRAPDLYARTRELVERADGYVVLPGQAGTLAELAFLWALDRAGCLGRRPVVLLGGRWNAVLEALAELDVLEPSQLRRSRFVEHPAQAVELLCTALGPEAR